MNRRALRGGFGPGVAAKRRIVYNARLAHPAETPMALLVRIYFNAVFGALGGLIGWMLFGVFGNKNPAPGLPAILQMFLGGGGLFGWLVR